MAPFRRRAASPTRIEFLEDISPVQMREELLPDIPSPSFPQIEQISMEDLDQTQLNALLEREAESGTQTAHTVLRTALETRQVATATAESLSAQTKQLEDIAETVEDVRVNVGRAEVVVDKLAKSKLRRVAEKPLNLFSSRDNRTRRRQKSDVSEKRWRRKSATKENADDNSQVVFVGEKDEYEDFASEGVRNNLKKQDEYLDEAAVVLDELRGLATGMAEELEHEAAIVDSIDATEVTVRIRASNRKIRRRLLS